MFNPAKNSAPFPVLRQGVPLALFSFALLFGWLTPTRGRFDLEWLPHLGSAAAAFAAYLAYGMSRSSVTPFRMGPIQVIGLLLLLALLVSLIRATAPYPDILLFPAGGVLAALCAAALASGLTSHPWREEPADVWVQRTVVLGALCTAYIMLQQAAAPVPRLSWISEMAPGVRPAGHFFQRNLASLLLVMGCVAAWGERGRKSGWLPWVLCPLFIFCLSLTESRAGLMLLLSAALFLGWGSQPVGIRRPAVALAAAGVTALLYQAALRLQGWVLALPEGGGSNAVQRLWSGELVELRWAVSGHALALWQKHPLLGGGWGTFNAWELDQALTLPLTVYATHSHNLVTQLLAETGLVFTLPILGLGIWSLWRRRALLGQLREAPRAWVNMVLVLLLLLHSMVEFPLWENFFLLLLFWCWQRLDEFGPRPGRSLMRGIPALLGAGALLWSLWLGSQMLTMIERYAESTRTSSPQELLAQRVAAADHARGFGLQMFRDLLIYTAFPLSNQEAAARLEIGSRLVRYAPDWWLLEKQAHLLALAGRPEASAELLARACAMHVNHCAQIYEHLIDLTFQAPAVFRPVVRNFRNLPFGKAWPDPELRLERLQLTER